MNAAGPAPDVLTGQRRRLVRPLWLLVQFLVSAVLLAALVHFGNVGAVFDKLLSVSWTVLALPVAIVIATFVLGAIRWQLLLRAVGIRIPAGRVISLTLFSNFCHQVVLAGLGDVVRIGALVRAKAPLHAAAMSVIFDRALGIAALIALVLAGLGLVWARVGNSGMSLTLLLSVLIPTAVLAPLLALDVLAIKPVRAFIANRQGKPVWTLAGRLIRFGDAFSEGARKVLFTRNSGWVALALSIAVQLSFCFALWLLASGLGFPVTLGDALLVVPPSLLISAIPISIGGWGVREGALTGGLMAIGLDRVAAIEISLCFGLVLMAGNLVGLIGWPSLFAMEGIDAGPRSDSAPDAKA